MGDVIMIGTEALAAKFPQLSDVTDFRTGGQKKVYSAVHPTYGKVALKLIVPSAQFERVEREIDVVKRLNLLNVPKIHETGFVEFPEGRLFYMLEQLVDGVSLREKYPADSKMSKDEAMKLLDTMLTVIESLELGHVIHRDIKPENILVGADGAYWLIDFGAARDMDGSTLTMTGKCAPLTPGYAAPEQFKAELRNQLDSRADLFALGVTTYEMLSGSNPFVRTDYSPYDVLRSTVVETADTLDIPGDERGELAGFVKTLMQKSPSFRPRSAKLAHTIFNALST